MNERECLLKKIDIISFHMDDTRLFLDTHPCDREAMCYFEKLHKVRMELIEEYNCKFGPLNAYEYVPAEEWAWARCPQPWDKGGNY